MVTGVFGTGAAVTVAIEAGFGREGEEAEGFFEDCVFLGFINIVIIEEIKDGGKG